MLNQKAIEKLRSMGKGVATVSVAPSDWNAIVDVLSSVGQVSAGHGGISLIMMEYRKMVLEILDDPSADA